jgi:hypothetical protein
VEAGRPEPSLWRARSRQLLAGAEVVVLLAFLLNILSLGTGLVTAWAAVALVLVIVVTLRVMHLDGDLKTLSASRRGRAPHQRSAARAPTPGRAQSA